MGVAQAGGKYALVVDYEVLLVATAAEFPQWPDAPTFDVVDVTGQDVLPGDMRSTLGVFTRSPGPTYWYDRNADQWVVDLERVRKHDLDTALAGDVQVTALKAMTNAEYNTWFDTNITNAAQAIQLLKRILRVLIRRVL